VRDTRLATWTPAPLFLVVLLFHKTFDLMLTFDCYLDPLSLDIALAPEFCILLCIPLHGGYDTDHDPLLSF